MGNGEWGEEAVLSDEGKSEESERGGMIIGYFSSFFFFIPFNYGVSLLNALNYHHTDPLFKFALHPSPCKSC